MENSNKEKIKYEADFSKNAIQGITKKLPNIVLTTAFILGLVVFAIIASHEIKAFSKCSYWLAGAIFLIILFFDIIFTLSSVVTASFLKVKSYGYAGLFFSLTVLGFVFTIWRSLEFSEAMHIQEEEVEFALKVILVFACILRAIFSEGGAFMLFAFSFKEEAKAETSESRNTETDANATFQTFLDYCKEAGLDKSEEKILPDVISKISENLYLIDNIEKTYEQIGGLKRSYKSKMNEEIENKSFEKGFQKFQIFQYWKTIENIIKKNNEEYPTGTWSENVKVPEPYEQKEPKINGNKKPEYSK